MCVSPIFFWVPLNRLAAVRGPPGNASCFGQFLVCGEFCGICDVENNYV